jgi:DNA repair photolyase
VEVTVGTVGRILTRSSGFLTTVTSHSLQPYRGCALGNSLCGVGCYVRHSWYTTRGREWGSFVEVRTNAAEAYRAEYESERAWARANRGRFGVFLSSSTEPFQPAERKFRVTRSVLEAMIERPPDLLIVQTHSHHVVDYLDIYPTFTDVVPDLRFHISIETDRDTLPGLPPSASPVEKRIEAAGLLHAAGFRVVITVSPLLAIAAPERFFARLSEVADAVVIDHYIGGDGSPAGSRTRRTPLPQAMEAVEPGSATLEYRDRIVSIAKRHFRGPVGVNIDGFAGRMLQSDLTPSL